MRVLVTGATGFLGSHVVRELLLRGHEVLVLARSTSSPRRLADIVERLRFHPAAPDRLGEAFADGPVHAVVNAAASYGRGPGADAELVEANVRFPVALLTASITHGVGAFVHVGSALAPAASTYALSKRHAEDWIQRLAAGSPEMRVVMARPQMIYGPGDDAWKFVASLVQRCLANETAYPMTLGEQRRDLVHVADAVSALCCLVEDRRAAGLIDIGTGVGVRMRDLATDIRDRCGSRTELVFGALVYRDGEPMESIADLTALAALGWEPTMSLHDGLDRTIAWHRTHTDWRIGSSGI